MRASEINFWLSHLCILIWISFFDLGTPYKIHSMVYNTEYISCNSDVIVWGLILNARHGVEDTQCTIATAHVSSECGVVGELSTDNRGGKEENR